MSTPACTTSRNGLPLFSQLRRLALSGPRSPHPHLSSHTTSLSDSTLPTISRQLRVLRTTAHTLPFIKNREPAYLASAGLHSSISAHRNPNFLSLVATMPTTTATTTAKTQSRGHAGHSHGHGHHHHHHDNTYLVSKNKNDAGVRITRIGLFVNLGMAVGKGAGGYFFHSQGTQSSTRPFPSTPC